MVMSEILSRGHCQSTLIGKPRQLETEEEMYEVAVRALMRRAHSVHEMKQKLERRSDNKLAYAYLLTPAGVREKVRMARRFLSRREAEFEALRTTIARLRAEVGESGSQSG